MTRTSSGDFAKGVTMRIESHYEESLQKDIEQISEMVRRMAHIGEAAIQSALRALEENDVQLSYIVIIRDKVIDHLEDEIDQKCLSFIIRHQPMAIHLRFVYSVLKMVSSLERVGDYAESIAKQALLLHDLKANFKTVSFNELADTSITMFHNAIEAFLNRDVERALSLIEAEDTADRLRSDLNKKIIESNAKGKLPKEAVDPLLTVARRLERLADHAKNICQETQYIVTGKNVKHSGVSGYDILFIDEDSRIGPIAEAIGKRLGNPLFRFTSVSLTGAFHHPDVVEFMRKKGMDFSAEPPRALEEVMYKNEFHLVILLSKSIRPSDLRSMDKFTILEWPVRLPKTRTEGAGATASYYDGVYQYLEEHIHDLVQAIMKQDELC